MKGDLVLEFNRNSLASRSIWTSINGSRKICQKDVRNSLTLYRWHFRNFSNGQVPHTHLPTRNQASLVALVATSADSVPSSKTNIFQSKLIYFRHFRTYSRCAMFDWSDTVFLRRNVTRRRISNTVLQPRYWGREADSPEACRLGCSVHFTYCTPLFRREFRRKRFFLL